MRDVSDNKCFGTIFIVSQIIDIQGNVRSCSMRISNNNLVLVRVLRQSCFVGLSGGKHGEAVRKAADVPSKIVGVLVSHHRDGPQKCQCALRNLVLSSTFFLLTFEDEFGFRQWPPGNNHQ